MPTSVIGKRALHRLVFIFFLWMIAAARAQTTSLALSSGTVAHDGVASMVLFLEASAGVSPAAVQWTFQNSAGAISRISIDDGGAVTSVGKTITCTGSANTCTCLAVGLSAASMPNGIIAKVSLTLVPGASAAKILVTDALGVSASGDPILISAAGGTITAANGATIREPRQTWRRRR